MNIPSFFRIIWLCSLLQACSCLAHAEDHAPTKALASAGPATTLRGASPIDTLPFTISAPGSYYVTKPLNGSSGNDGIIIASDNVTIDLNGCALVGGSGSRSGIEANVLVNNINIRNGVITGWGDCGIQFAQIGNVTIESIQIANNGQCGVSAGDCLIRSCLVTKNGQDGIDASSSIIDHCNVIDNEGSGIAAFKSSIDYCQVTKSEDNSQGQIKPAIAATTDDISNCNVSSSVGDGISATQGTRIVNNNVHGLVGIRASGQFGRNHIEGNTVSVEINSQEAAIVLESPANIVSKNVVQSRGKGIDVGTGNIVGPAIDATSIGSATNPFANIQETVNVANKK